MPPLVLLTCKRKEQIMPPSLWALVAQRLALHLVFGLLRLFSSQNQSYSFPPYPCYIIVIGQDKLSKPLIGKKEGRKTLVGSYSNNGILRSKLCKVLVFGVVGKSPILFLKKESLIWYFLCLFTLPFEWIFSYPLFSLAVSEMAVGSYIAFKTCLGFENLGFVGTFVSNSQMFFSFFIRTLAFLDNTFFSKIWWASVPLASSHFHLPVTPFKVLFYIYPPVDLFICFLPHLPLS